MSPVDFSAPLELLEAKKELWNKNREIDNKYSQGNYNFRENSSVQNITYKIQYILYERSWFF